MRKTMGNINWDDQEYRRRYSNTWYYKNKAKPRIVPAWREPAWMDFKTGRYALKKLASKYKVSVNTVSKYITKRIKNNVEAA